MTQQGETSRNQPAPPRRKASALASAALALVFLLPLLAGCESGPPSQWLIAERMSAPPDAEVFSLSTLTTETLVTSWLMSEPARAGLWQVEPRRARGAVDRRGLWIRAAGDNAVPPRLTAQVEIVAPEVTVVELRLRNSIRTDCQLLWAGAGQEFSADRRISDVGHDRGPVRFFRFRVGEHPQWRGTIRRLQIRPAIPSRRDFAVISVRALRQRPSPDLLAAASSRAWKVGLGNTLREARLAFPGRPWTATVRVPKGETELRFVPGLPAATDGQIELSVRSAAGDGRRDLLFSAAYSPPAADAGGWQEPVRIPLTGLADRQLDLTFAMTTTGADGAAAGFAAWGGVQLVVAGREPRPPNVVLIAIDTLRADRLSAYGHDRQTSPNIDRWAKERAVLFEQVVAPSPWTLPSFISIFTGLDAVRHGANYHLPARSGLEMLAETLAGQGYETAAWTGGGYLGPAHGLHQGFESLTYHLGPKADELAANIEPAIDWLGSRRDRPFFLLFHTYEVHDPYFQRQPFYDRFAERSGLPPIPSDWVAPRRRPPQPDDGFMVSRELMMSPDRGRSWQQVPPELRAGVADRYDAGIAHADEQIGRLLDAIEEHGHASRTVVILTSDHGEALGERGLGGHSYLDDFNLMVPLIIAAPSASWPAGKRVPQQVRSVDIVPTVRELVGLEAGEELDGESLVPLVHGRTTAGDRLAWSYAAISNRGVALRLPTVKYLFNNTAARPIFAQERLFDLARDPQELDDIADQRPADAARFRRLVRRRLADQVAAVWFRLRSGNRYPMTVELTGLDTVGPSRLKAVELPSDGVRYDTADKGRAVVELPAAAEALLYSEVLTNGTVQLRVDSAAPGLESRRWTLKIPDIAKRSWSASVTNGAWTEQPAAAGASGPGLSIFTTHGLEAGPGPAQANREIEDQLRALGYVQ